MSKTVGNLLEHTYQALHAGNVEDPRTESEWLLENLLSMNRSEIYVSREKRVEVPLELQLTGEIQRRLLGEPIQYIVGKVPFMDGTFNVDKSVLIPRSETELLVEHAQIYLKRTPAETVLDIGTGSGVLAISLALAFPNMRLIALDISSAALAVAQKNALLNGVEKQISFVLGDMRNVDMGTQVFDAIVTNPPYIKSDEISCLQDEVCNYEPRVALDGGSDGLLFYRVLASKCKSLLRPGGVIFTEIGAGQAVDVKNIIEKNNSMTVCSTITDYAGIQRIVMAKQETLNG